MEPHRYVERLISTTQTYEAEYEAKINNIFRSEQDQAELYAWCPVSQVQDAVVYVLQNQSSSSSGDRIAESKTGEDTRPFQSVVRPTHGCYKLLKNIHECREHLQSQISTPLSIFHIRQIHSFSRLLVTKSVFEELSRHYNVFPRFKDAFLYLGRRQSGSEVEVSPPRLQLQICPAANPFHEQADFECCYGIRYMEINGRSNTFNPWSMRQSTVYNQTNFSAGSAVWIFVSLPHFVQEVFNDYHKNCATDIERRPFDVHCILLHAIISPYRVYFAFMTEKVDESGMKVLTASTDAESTGIFAGWTERRKLKKIEDDILDSILALSSTKTTVQRISNARKLVSKRLGSPSTDSGETYGPDAFQILKEEIDAYLEQAHMLRDKIRSTIEAVSTFLELANGLKLEGLAKDAGEENIKIKALSVMTLIYLPTTVVSNFFSTSFVASEVQANQARSMVVAQNWWILVAASLPLTLATVGIWGLWVQVERRRNKRRAQAQSQGV